METHSYRPVLPADPKRKTREIIEEVAKRKAEKRFYQRELAARFFRKSKTGRSLTPEESRQRLRTFVAKHRGEIDKAARQYSKRQ